MRLKTFRAFTLAEALDAVHDDLGRDAAVLHTRTFRRGGFLGIGGREVVEVIASEGHPETSILPAVTRPRSSADSPAIDGEGSDAPESSAEPAAPIAAGVSARARAAYSSTRASAGATEVGEPSASEATPESSDDVAPVTSASLEVDRARTRSLARAMALRLERQQAARTAAGVSNADDLVGGGQPPEPVTSPAIATATTPASPLDVQRRDEPATSKSESFIIGPGGLLVPDDAPGSEPDPRVVELDSPRLAPDPVTGVPTMATDGFIAEQVPAIALPSEEAEEPAAEASLPDQPKEEPIAPAKPAAAESPAPSELDAIRRTVGRVLADGESFDTVSAPSVTGVPDPLADAYAALVAQELSRDLAERVVASLESSLDENARRDPARVRAAMLHEIADLVPTSESLESARPRDGRPRTIAFVGPTGVGKTTTLAKIAATLVIREKLSVGLVTADTYRISAVDQLRTYAEILGARLEVASDPTEMRAAIERCGDLDAVLVDTPGRSQNDADRLAELRAIVDAARPHETHLVLSGTASERVLLREAEAFSSLGPDRVVLTKLDEAVAFGMLVSVVRRIGRRISWMTTGQEVPRDIEQATGSRLADLVLGGAVRA